MTPDLFRDNRVIIQGIGGTHGRFHTKQMLASGTMIVAGTSPTKSGQIIETIPVFSSIEAAKAHYDINTSVIFVPAPHAKDAILEAIAAKIRMIVCITEGIPVHDMLVVNHALQSSNSVLIGPNCPGVLLPNIVKLGIIPATLGLNGSTAIVSRSGTLTYEIAAGLTARGLGQKYIIGIGGDRIHGVSFTDCIELFQNDPDVETIVVVGEIGGNEEIAAANYIADSVTKPVFGYIAGHHAPTGVQLGHAGAILKSSEESAAAKTASLRSSGVHMFESVLELIEMIQ